MALVFSLVPAAAGFLPFFWDLRGGGGGGSKESELPSEYEGEEEEMWVFIYNNYHLARSVPCSSAITPFRSGTAELLVLSFRLQNISKIPKMTDAEPSANR